MQLHEAALRNRAGRKRKQRVRRDTTSGRSRGELCEDIVGTAMAYRIKNGARPADASNALAGFTLGLMRLCGLAAVRSGRPDPRGISAAQFDAGESWAALCRSYEALSGIPSPNPRAAGLDIGGGLSVAAEPDPDRVAQIKAQYARCYNALADCARTAQDGRRPGWSLMSLTYAVCCQNRDLSTLSDEACGDVRSGLNALGRVLG